MLAAGVILVMIESQNRFRRVFKRSLPRDCICGSIPIRAAGGTSQKEARSFDFRLEPHSSSSAVHFKIRTQFSE